MIKAFGGSATGFPSLKSTRRSTSSWNGPKLNDLGASDIQALILSEEFFVLFSMELIFLQCFPKDFETPFE
jgi:hypothetical protein